MNEEHMPREKLIRIVVSRYLMALAALAALFFVTAGTFAYWEAWAYLAILFGAMLLVGIYLLKNDPDLLERRMRFKERAAEQKLIIKLGFIPFLFAFILPGLDKRFGWSHVSLGDVVAGEILVLVGYGLVFLVFRENRYASRVVEVEQGQAVIRSGPYALVRHPMYLGSIVLYVFSPLALGSYWAMIPAALIIPVLMARILSEEKILMRDLKGYREYMQKTRYRLLPGIW